jgi:hypothetical protein
MTLHSNIKYFPPVSYEMKLVGFNGTAFYDMLLNDKQHR